MMREREQEKGWDGRYSRLKEGAEVARLRRRFSFVLRQALSFRTRHHLCRQGMALASTPQLRSQGPVLVQAHRTEGVTGSGGQEGANGVGGGVGVGGGNGDCSGVGGGNGDVNGHRDGDGAGAGTGTEVEVNEGAQDGNGDRSGDGAGTGMGTGTGTGVETRRRTQDGNGDGNGDGSKDDSGDGNGDEDTRIGNKDRIGRAEERRGRGSRPVDEHRMGTGTGTGTEASTVAEVGTGTAITGTGTRIRSGRAEEMRRSARNRTRLVGATWETGKTLAERGKM